MTTVNIYEAKTNLSKLLEKVQNGETVVIAKAGKPIADLKPYEAPKNQVKFGTAKGRKEMDIPDDVFDGIDSEIMEIFFGKDWENM